MNAVNFSLEAYVNDLREVVAGSNENHGVPSRSKQNLRQYCRKFFLTSDERWYTLSRFFVRNSTSYLLSSSY